MRAFFKAGDPGELEFTMTMTMTLSQWKDLRAELGKKWPASRLDYAIGVMVTKAEAVFYAEHESDL